MYNEQKSLNTYSSEKLIRLFFSIRYMARSQIRYARMKIFLWNLSNIIRYPTHTC